MGAKISKATPPVFIRSEPNLMINNAVIMGHKVMDVLAMYPKLKILWHFEILTWESMKKS